MNTLYSGDGRNPKDCKEPVLKRLLIKLNR